MMTSEDNHESPRPLAIRQSLAHAFLQKIEAHFEANAETVIDKICAERPLDYLKIVIGLLPDKLAFEKHNSEEMTNDELAAVLRAVRSAIAARTGEPSRKDGAQGGASMS